MLNRPHIFCLLASGAGLVAATPAQQSPFGPAQPLFASSVPVDLCIADLTGDGRNDLVYAAGSEIVLVVNQDGALPFTPFSAVIDFALPGVNSVRAIDLDADGDLDLVAGSAVNVFNGTGSLVWYENDGSGGFGPSSVFVGAVVALEVGDLDGDGDDDLVIASPPVVFALENDGSGAPVLGSILQVQGDPITGQMGDVSIEIADLDGNGSNDVAVTVSETDTVQWIRNEPFPGVGLNGAPNIVSTFDGTPRSVTAVDQDGDGDLDLVVAFSSNPSSGQVLSYRNEGGASFSGGTIVDLFASGASSLASTDVDVDGRVDVVSALRGSARVRLYQNTGCLCTVPIEVAAPDAPAVVAVGDIDGDGADDLVVAGGTTAPGGSVEFAWHRNEQPDCNANGIADGLDFVAGILFDCDGNGIGDACELAAGTALDLNANGLLDRCEALGAPYCTPAVPNSTGLPSRIRAVGQDLVFFNDVLLVAEDLPPQQFGFFLVSSTQGVSFPVPNSQGRICLAGDIGRFNLAGQIKSSGPEGRIALDVDLGQLPIPTGLVSVAPGETWSFQLWHRDVNPGATSNFTDGLEVSFR